MFKSVISSWRETSLNGFFYLIETYPNLKRIQDRLGRIILHVIFQYDIFECMAIRDNIFNAEDFLIKYFR